MSVEGANLLVYPDERIGEIKPMHCVNNGPVVSRLSNFEDYQAAGIPFARNHDAALFNWYGGEHIVDVAAVFPDFQRSPEDASAYDFTLTDAYLADTLRAGTKIFYRLGTKIEHWKKKYQVIPPSDPAKWARVCERIIAHYNEGWADGFRWGIEYWEIWNEPDLREAMPPEMRPTWCGTAEEFFAFYRLAARHLKAAHPGVKIGGPSVSRLTSDWTDRFLAAMTADGERVPLDFFSWHQYTYDPRTIGEFSRKLRQKLDSYGYADAESILNEYNYVEDWTGQPYLNSVATILDARGAAFTAACFCEGQNAPLDMLMYYDARPSVFNGMFDFYTFRRLAGYYPFPYFAALYRLGHQVRCTSDQADLYAVAARGEDGRLAVFAAFYSLDKERRDPMPLRLVLDDRAERRFRRRVTAPGRLDEEEALSAREGVLEMTLQPSTVMLLEEIR